MNDRGANIDIVFRNGLKDYEVLPPPEVWHNIQPVIKRKVKPFRLIRTAALIAVVLSMSFLASRWGREVSTGIENSDLALNTVNAFQVYNPGPLTAPVALTIDDNSLAKFSQNKLPIVTQDQKEVTDKMTFTSSSIQYLNEKNRFSSKDNVLIRGTHVATSFTRQNNNLTIEEINSEYLPELSNVKVAEKWSIAAMASPTYYSRFNSGTDELSKQLASSEQPLVSYSGGFSLGYKINKRFSIQSGLYYSSLGQEVEGINSFAGFQKYVYTKGDRNFEVLTANGTIYTNNADVFLSSNGSVDRVLTNYNNDVFDPNKASLDYINNSLRQNFSYLELPVILKYKFVDKTVALNLIGGMSYNLLINNSVYTMVNGTKYPVGKTEGVNPISISSSLGMGMEYSFSKNFTLNLEPTFRYYMNPFTGTTGSKIHPYTFGVFSGVSYKF
jgi:hypothetical protein